MRKITFLAIGLMVTLCNGQLFAQRTCAAHDHMLDQLENSGKFQENQHDLEEYTKEYSRTFQSLKAGEIRTIPLHVIVVYANSQENISDAQIQSQIDVLNLDYGGTNSDLSSTPSEFSAVTSNGTGIQFVLDGIERHSNSKTSWGTNDLVKSTYPPTSPATTLNMWICNIGGGILGYAQFPGGAASTDGVVFSPQYCGSSDYNDGSFYLSAPFDKGRTCTHEVGHYLNLRHIWGDGNCSADDYVDDTPIAGAANYGCPSFPSKSCSSNGGWTSDMFMNYMDYVDDGCMFMFSDGQSARMWACLNSSRSELGYSGGNANPTAVANGPYNGESDVSLAFSSAGSSDSDGTIASYVWDFGDGSSSIEPNPSHTYLVDGLYTVSLIVTDNEGAVGTATTSATIGNVCSGIQACDGDISFSLTTDKYASETSWTLKNSAGSTIESGSGYSNNTSYTLSWDLTEGTYTFTINDSYGDGICCSYGSGSYSIIDGCSSILKTGGDYGSGESVEFCVPEGSSPPINIEPTAEANGPYTGTENENIVFSSNSSADSDGTIASYLWDFGDGFTSVDANPSHSYATAGTYIVTLTITDDDGAIDDDTALATIIAVSSSESVILISEGFESGWGSWTDGGSDCSRYTGGSRAYGGSAAIDIQDNSGTKSSFYLTNGIDVATEGFTSIEVEFYFYAYSMESGEDFWVQYHDGSTWNTVAAFARGTNFNNSTFYVSTVTINESDYNFPTNMKIGFRCDASGNADDVYIDDITITAKKGNARKKSDISVSELYSLRLQNEVDVEDEISLYPNPANDVLNLMVNIEDNAVAYIFNSTGQLMKSIALSNDQTLISIEELPVGIYFFKVNAGDEVYNKKFIKK